MQFPVIGKTICTAFFLASVSVCQVDQRCPGTAYEQNAKIISSLEPLKQVAHSEGYSRLVFRLRVTDSGRVQDAIGTYPANFMRVQKLKEQVFDLRFCPAVKYSRFITTDVQFDIQIK